MKTSIFSLVFLFFGLSIAKSQSPEHVFGKLSQKEFDMKKYEKDPDAEAVVLFDIGLTKFIDKNNSYVIEFSRTRRVKILDEAGVDYAEVTIPYYVDGYGKTEYVKSIEAVSYNYEDKKLSKSNLDLSTVYDEVISERWKAKKFVLPDVHPGTIIEYRYVVETPFHYNLPDWEFQDQIPTIYSKYTTKMIPFYEYIYIAQGIKKFTYQDSKVESGLSRRFGRVEFNDMVYTFVMEDVPAFKDEAYMTSIQDYIIKIDFQLKTFTNLSGVKTDIMSTWEEMNKSMLKHENFGKYIKKGHKKAEDILESELDMNGLNDWEKTRLIVNYVKKSFNWNDYNAKYASKSAKDLITERTGNAADINLFLIAMLQAAGIDAQPVLISTRSHGKLKSDYPFSHFFNYVVVLVNIDGSSIVTDATNVNLDFDQIPPRCMNEQGMVVSEGDVKWVKLSSNTPSTNEISIKINVDPESALGTANVTAMNTNYESLQIKEEYENDSSQFYDFLQKHGYSNISKIKFKNYEDPTKPYFYGYSGDMALEILGDKLLIKPFLDIPPAKNQLTQKTRSYPVDFIYPKTVKLKSEIILPDNYILIDKPDKINIENDLAIVSVRYEHKGNTFRIDGEYTFKKSVYQPNEYSRVKFYLDNIVKIFNSPIVIEKVKENN